MRAVKIAVVVMGVLIVLATAALIAAVIRRNNAPPPPLAAALPIPVPGLAPSPPAALTLDEPAGTHVGSMLRLQQGMALLLQGGGPDRVVILDATGHPTARIALTR